MANEVIHFEVTGNDGPALQRFYSDVFGWKLDTNNPGGYGMYRGGNGVTGGIGAANEGQPDGVHFYVVSDDPQGILDKVAASGGKVLLPLTEVAPETTIALFADPEGHVVGLM
jgi:uncharacterized protein